MALGQNVALVMVNKLVKFEEVSCNSMEVIDKTDNSSIFKKTKTKKQNIFKIN